MLFEILSKYCVPFSSKQVGNLFWVLINIKDKIFYSIIKDFIVVLTGIDIRIYIRITLNLYKKRIE